MWTTVGLAIIPESPCAEQEAGIILARQGIESSLGQGSANMLPKEQLPDSGGTIGAATRGDVQQMIPPEMHLSVFREPHTS